MPIKYFSTAWNDITSSPSWFPKLLLLGLVYCIPVFGQIVVLGYAFGWAREIAWGAHTPMPQHIFANEDGKLYRRGFFTLVIMFVFMLVPGILEAIGAAMQGATAYADSLYGAGFGVLPVIGGIFNVASAVAAFLISMPCWIGVMRMTLYDRLSAGFQLPKIWSMLKRDAGGMWRILGMSILMMLVVEVIFTLIIGLFVVIAIASAVGIAGPAYFSGSLGANMGADFGILAGGLLALGGVFIVLFIAVCYFGMVASVFVLLMVARAVGHWTSQFDVPHWRGQDDPMPFELA